MKHFCSFSEAIREGSKLREQGFGSLVSNGKSCALAAGYEALGILNLPTPAREMYEMYPYMMALRDCPASTACGRVQWPTASIVSHLNDTHEWAREQIADWLEREEEKLGFVLLTEESEVFKPELVPTV